MPDTIKVAVNGKWMDVPAGATVAVAIVLAGEPCRTSVRGDARGPLCGMGICFECRAIVDGARHQRTCQILCQPLMEIATQ